MENHFVILINGTPYESAANLYTAKHLFNTVDSTINREYNGSTKTLAYVGNRYDRRTWKNILTGIVNYPRECVIVKKKNQ